MNLYFNFTRKQLEEFIYDLRMNVGEHYINIIMKICQENDVIVCAVPSDRIEDLVKDARKNTRKTIDEFINDYHEQNVINNIQVTDGSLITDVVYC